MKLHFPIEQLWRQVWKMGAQERSYSLDAPTLITTTFDPRVEQLNGSGTDIALEDVDVTGGLLSSHGAQIILYIPDHGKWLDKALINGHDGNKFHVADCTVLEKMRKKNRFQRYKALVNITGGFDIFGYSSSQVCGMETTARLRVCMMCLTHLNYKGYTTELGRKSQILHDFNLKDFFAEHSTLFRYLPTAFIELKSGYANDWKKISRNFRARKNYSCESCGVDLNGHKNLLHCHHTDGNKRHNSAANLQALCADCHRKQPLHDHMYVKTADLSVIQKLRKNQGVLGDTTDWNDLFQLIDPPYQGLLRLYKSRNEPKPEIGYEVIDSSGAVKAEVEIAWPSAQFAVVDDEPAGQRLSALGWRSVTLEEALRGFRDKK
jgi:hypothetical protein